MNNYIPNDIKEMIKELVAYEDKIQKETDMEYLYISEYIEESEPDKQNNAIVIYI